MQALEIKMKKIRIYVKSKTNSHVSPSFQTIQSINGPGSLYFFSVSFKASTND
jgi:hypothetical protein